MMNRLQKKCFIAAAACHGLLVLILLFGAALMPSPPEPAFHPITVYDASKISDLLTSGGGPQEVKALPPAPQAEAKPAPTPPAPPVPKPPAAMAQPHVEQPQAEVQKPPVEPPVEPMVKHWYTPWRADAPPISDESTAKPTKTTKQHKHEIVLDSSDFKKAASTSHETSTSTSTADSQANAARRQAAREFASTLRNISKNLSTSTVVDMPGDGSGAEATVNYRDVIASKYYNAWIAPTDLDGSTLPVVLARVTIARNGDVISAHVIEPSGNRSMDRSIENVLETVRFIEPFPENSHDQERTVTIKFNLQMKQKIG